MNTNVPSGRDGVHVYALPNEAQIEVQDIASTREARYLIVRDKPGAHEDWAEIVATQAKGDRNAA